MNETSPSIHTVCERVDLLIKNEAPVFFCRLRLSFEVKSDVKIARTQAGKRSNLGLGRSLTRESGPGSATWNRSAPCRAVVLCAVVACDPTTKPNAVEIPQIPKTFRHAKD
eukprot:1843548-Rhodomonas_salina.1